MKNKEEIKAWLLENCITERGNLDLSNLDFSDFDGNVYICGMKVKKSLYQDNQTVGEDLVQSRQEVGKDLYQDIQKVNGTIYQDEVEE